eukprot:15086327-Ditylum_brightwellii.AAC.1
MEAISCCSIHERPAFLVCSNKTIPKIYVLWGLQVLTKLLAQLLVTTKFVAFTRDSWDSQPPPSTTVEADWLIHNQRQTAQAESLNNLIATMPNLHLACRQDIVLENSKLPVAIYAPH